jgi:hypothetical protein
MTTPRPQAHAESVDNGWHYRDDGSEQQTHANETELHHTDAGDGCCRGSDRRRTNGSGRVWPLQPVTMMGPNTSVAEQINPVDIHGGSDHGDYRGFHRGGVPWWRSPWTGGHHR